MAWHVNVRDFSHKFTLSKLCSVWILLTTVKTSIHSTFDKMPLIQMHFNYVTLIRKLIEKCARQSTQKHILCRTKHLEAHLCDTNKEEIRIVNENMYVNQSVFSLCLASQKRERDRNQIE